jgi:fructose-specific phosphotransferase system IIC component
VEHLFISCHFARLIWQVVFAAYNIPPPSNITNLFGNWLNGTDKSDKDRIRIDVSALCWSI